MRHEIYELSIYNRFTHHQIQMAQNNRLDFQFLGNNKIQTESTFSILCEGQPHQVLQISLPPNCSTYIRGRMVYTNCPAQPPIPLGFAFRFEAFTFRNIKMNLWHNKSQQMEIVGITHLFESGPILILDLSIYKESFYINFQNVIASKYALIPSVPTHPKIRTLRKVDFKDRAASLQEFFKNNQKIALQATYPIIEKYLGPGELFSLQRANIQAMSQTIQVDQTYPNTKLVGPGWVFYEANWQKPIRQTGFFLVSAIFLIISYFILITMI